MPTGTALRRRYSELVRRYHPDRNGGDRGFEGKLGAVIEAYQLLKGARGLRRLVRASRTARNRPGR